MKVTIAYLPEEERKAKLLQSIAQGAIPCAKVKETGRHAPFKHIYISTEKPKNYCDSKENS